MTSLDYIEVIKALALGKTAEANALQEQHAQGDQGGEADLISAVFCIVIEHRFGEDSSPQALDDFMKEVRRDYASSGLKFLTAEALVRVILRDEDEYLLDEISGDDQIQTQLALIRKCVYDSAELTARIDDVMTDAKNMVAAWDAEDDALASGANDA